MIRQTLASGPGHTLGCTLSFGLALLAQAACLSADTPPTPSTLELQMQPAAPHVQRVQDVHLILTLKNVGTKARTFVLPYLDNHDWYQWIQVFRDGQKLPARVDEDYAYLPTVLRPGQQLSVLVSLDKFYDVPNIGSGAGHYSVRWDGGTIGFASTASASFEVGSASAESADAFALDSYLTNAAGLSIEDQTRQLWKDVLKSPADPKWLPLLRIVPKDYIDMNSLLDLAETTNDLGLRREAVRALSKVGKQPGVIPRLVALLKSHEDKPLGELAFATLQSLRGGDSGD